MTIFQHLFGNPTTYCQGILRFLQILEFWIKVGCLFEILFTFRQIWRRRDLVKNFTQAPRTNCRSSSTTIGLNSYRWCPTTCSLKVLLVKTLEILTAVSAKREKEKWFDLVPDPPQLYRLRQPNWEYTMWKFQDFSATQILREINFDHGKPQKLTF